MSGSFRAVLRGSSERIPSGACKILSIYEFDDVRVDPRAFRVLKAGRPVAVEPKAFAVLLFLLENPGRLVEKKELLERVWPDTVVTESAMTRVIADLRKALGDPAREARYIETVPTRGYRFIAEVRKLPEDAAVFPMPPVLEPASAPRRLPPRLIWFAAGAVGLVVLVVGLRAARRRAVPAAGPPATPTGARQLTDSLGLDLFPSFSPDGAQIAYCSDRGNSFEIFVRQLTAGGREIQITADGQDNLQPAWSPDGREIAYASRDRPGIWLVPALGGTPRRLTEFGSRPAWSPDGTTLAFQSAGLTDVSASAPAAAPPSSLFLVPAAGGTPVPLTRPGSPAGGHGAPAFSPDGKTIVFSSWALNEGEIWSVSRFDGSLERIFARKGERPGLGIYYEPVYSPRGDRICFAATSGTWMNASLWTARLPSSAGKPWGEPERVTSAGPASLRQIAISPGGGSSLAYAALSSASNVWSLPIDVRSAAPAGDSMPLTRATGCRNSNPVFSPDGSRIAFVSCRAGAHTDVWVMNADGRNAHPLTDDPAGMGTSGWLPDGERIAFLSARDGSKALWSVTLSDRSAKRLLPIDVELSSARLSPDGRLLTFTSRTPDGLLSVWVAPLDGEAPRQVTFDRDGAGYACWSPDGKFLAVEVLRGPDMHIAIVPAAGGEPFIVTHERGLSWPYSWSPDGERIAFAGQRDGIWNVYWISRRGGPEHRLTNYSSRNSFVRYPAWSPRGDQIVYEYAETTGNIWLMDLPR
jgi:Tol biopolymer transport system component/DNA-binding winged helix-turn-helix (wHTH) protein